MSGVYRKLAELIRENKPAALATCLSTPYLGAKMLIHGEEDIETVGSIHPEIDNLLAPDALRLLTEGRNSAHTYKVQGIEIEVFIETFPPPQRLIIIGGVHVAIPLHRLAHMLGYHVTIVDARGMLATRERFPMADAVLTEWPDEAMEKLQPDNRTSVVVLTHDPKFDYPALASALSSQAAYIGAIGSRKTTTQRFDALREMGFTDGQLARIHAPIGLDIGAQSPAEIALAIMAEVVAARRGREGRPLSAR